MITPMMIDIIITYVISRRLRGVSSFNSALKKYTFSIERTGMIGTYYSRWNKTYGYVYLWWIKRIDGNNDIPFALGHGGQRIAFMQKVKAVMVTQADAKVKPSSSYKQHRAVDSLLFDDFAAYLLKYHGTL